MKEFYDAEKQVLIIRHEDFMNREVRIHISPGAYERVKRIEAYVNMRLADMDLISYKI